MNALELTTKALLGDFAESGKVFRFTTTIIDGIATQELSILYENIPCGLNRWGNRLRRTGNSGFQSSHQNIEYAAVLYLPLEYAVFAGDVVDVTQLGVVTRYDVLGCASRYATHQELFLVECTLA
ncbi:hypothetical protein RFF05_01785 [Bengtsoniella intestinalis]|uniref:hypothetical protein n=1 Tax=Bengtsoniella intestinalis TaxID=3073143 RepID=UPI00391F6BB1